MVRLSLLKRLTSFLRKLTLYGLSWLSVCAGWLRTWGGACVIAVVVVIRYTLHLNLLAPASVIAMKGLTNDNGQLSTDGGQRKLRVENWKLGVYGFRCPLSVVHNYLKKKFNKLRKNVEKDLCMWKLFRNFVVWKIRGCFRVLAWCFLGFV